VAIPKLEALAKEGEEGRKAIAEYTRYGAVVLGFLQATAFYFGLAQAVNERNVLSFITITLTFTAGTAFLMWLGEQVLYQEDPGEYFICGICTGWKDWVGVLLLFVVIIRIPVQYAKQG